MSMNDTAKRILLKEAHFKRRQAKLLRNAMAMDDDERAANELRATVLDSDAKDCEDAAAG